MFCNLLKLLYQGIFPPWPIKDCAFTGPSPNYPIVLVNCVLCDDVDRALNMV